MLSEAPCTPGATEKEYAGYEWLDGSSVHTRGDPLSSRYWTRSNIAHPDTPWRFSAQATRFQNVLPAHRLASRR